MTLDQRGDHIALRAVRKWLNVSDHYFNVPSFKSYFYRGNTIRPELAGLYGPVLELDSYNASIALLQKGESPATGCSSHLGLLLPDSGFGLFI